MKESFVKAVAPKLAVVLLAFAISLLISCSTTTSSHERIFWELEDSDSGLEEGWVPVLPEDCNRALPRYLPLVDEKVLRIISAAEELNKGKGYLVYYSVTNSGKKIVVVRLLKQK
jgi:hypothetical protein